MQLADGLVCKRDDNAVACLFPDVVSVAKADEPVLIFYKIYVFIPVFCGDKRAFVFFARGKCGKRDICAVRRFFCGRDGNNLHNIADFDVLDVFVDFGNFAVFQLFQNVRAVVGNLDYLTEFHIADRAVKGVESFVRKCFKDGLALPDVDKRAYYKVGGFLLNKFFLFILRGAAVSVGFGGCVHKAVRRLNVSAPFDNFFILRGVGAFDFRADCRAVTIVRAGGVFCIFEIIHSVFVFNGAIPVRVSFCNFNLVVVNKHDVRQTKAVSFAAYIVSVVEIGKFLNKFPVAVVADFYRAFFAV